MTAAAPRRRAGQGARSPARELTAALVLGAAGAGLVFLAGRPGWAHVRTVPPAPLPASTVTVTGAAMVPYASALVLAGLATLAAILATRGAARRAGGGLLAVIGAALAVSAFTISAAGAVSAAQAGASPAGAAGGSAAGSVTDGASRGGTTVPDIAGTAPHVILSAGGWQALTVAGALVMIAAGVLVIWRARAMAVMSSRYDAPGEGPAARPAPARPDSSAAMWEALSAGQDPTEIAGRPAS